MLVELNELIFLLILVIITNPALLHSTNRLDLPEHNTFFLAHCRQFFKQIAAMRQLAHD